MTADGPARRRAGTVEVFAWATDDDPAMATEKAAVECLAEAFARACPGQEFVNPLAARGAPSDPRRALHSRLRGDEPPDGFQTHPGGELRDYVDAGYLTDLSDRCARWGLVDVLPRGLLDAITVDGRIYTVPAGVHRLMLWSNEAVLAGAGLTARPATLDALVRDLDALRTVGVEHPLAVGADWTQFELLEAVLLAGLGPERFESLWTAGADWSGSDITGALNDYGRLLSYTNPDRDGLHWTDAARLLSDGGAGYLFMGDWVTGEWEGAGFGNYAHQPFPGTEEAFQWLGDSFVLPRNAPNPTGADCWLRTVGSSEGQRAFNTRKGSIPARTDANPADYRPYQRAAMADLRRLRLVPSSAHGLGCPQAVTAAVTGAVGEFSATGDVAGLRAAIADGVAAHRPTARTREGPAAEARGGP